MRQQRIKGRIEELKQQIQKNQGELKKAKVQKNDKQAELDKLNNNIMTKSDLKKLFELVINKLDIDNLNQFEFQVDEYWKIPTNKWDQFDQLPSPTLCSLQEDIEYLEDSINQDQISSYSDFDRIASILRAISEAQAPVGA